MAADGVRERGDAMTPDLAALTPVLRHLNATNSDLHRALSQELHRLGVSYDDIWTVTLGKTARAPHEATCKRGRALGSAAIECEHGFDVCPKCDPCSCDTAEASS